MVVLRAGLYERVSTEEQAKYGFSIQTQIDGLNEYCKKNKMKIVDHYTEEGVSGGKPSFKRPQMARLLEDVKAGKIDIILFTKLDRWFRNVKEYFKVQEILDEHKVEWKAIHEDYDTTSANGRMAITIFLAINQNEREKAAERSMVVLENKWKNKEATFGPRSMPFGYKKEKDDEGIPRLVKDPELKDALQDFWNIAVKYHNVTKAAKYVRQTYGVIRTRKSWSDVIHNEIYTGVFRGIDGFCEPYVSKSDWKTLQRKRIKKTQGERVYLFAGLVRCPACNRLLKSTYTLTKLANGEKKEYRAYNCAHKDYNICSYRHSVSEIKIERWLLSNLDSLIRDEIINVEIARSRPKPKPKVNISTLKEQLRRLEVVYMAGNKSDAEYLAETKEIKDKITKAEIATMIPEDNRDLTALQEILQTDFRGIYATLDAEDKRRFWRSIIKEIHVEGLNVKSVVFL